MGVGCTGAVAAQENATANETAANETIDWPTDSANVSVDDARNAIEETPGDLPNETVAAVADWASERENLEELGKSERERLTDWLLEARSLETIDRPDIPDVQELLGSDDSDGSDSDDDRDDDQDELEDENESTVETNGTTAGLANQRAIEYNNDANTSIVGWEFDDGRVTVALETERRTGVTVSDALAGIGEDGAVQVPKTQQFLERESVTRVTMDVSEYNGGHSVGVTVDGLTVRLSTEMNGDNPLRYFGGESGLFTGMIMSIVMSGAATGFVLWREESGVIRA